jgi:hypothetical protein
MKHIIIIFISILFFSCSSKSKIDNQEKINNSYSFALQEQISISNKIKQSISKGDFSSFNTDVDSSTNRFQRVLSEVSALEIDQTQEEYKKSVISALNSFKAMAEAGRKFNRLSVNSTEQDYNNLITEFNLLVDEKIPADIAKVISSKETK